MIVAIIFLSLIKRCMLIIDGYFNLLLTWKERLYDIFFSEKYVIHIAAVVQTFIKDETRRILTLISIWIAVNEKEYNLKICINFKKIKKKVIC